jgi:hypothetical protein
MALNGGLGLIAGLTVAGASALIMSGYGHDFLEGRGVLVVLAGAAVMAASVVIVGQAITSAGFMWWGFLLNAIWAVSLIACVWWLRARGAYGFAVANLVAYFIHLITGIYFYRQTSIWLFGAGPSRTSDRAA